MLVGTAPPLHLLRPERFDHGVSQQDAERALAELETLVKTYGDYPICVSDNILDQGYLRTFVPALKARTLGAKLFYEVKANLKKNDLRSLRDAGIDKIQPGRMSVLGTAFAATSNSGRAAAARSIRHAGSAQSASLRNSALSATKS